MRFFAFLVLVFTSATIHAREAWRFLPCFGKDVRGIERHAAEGHFYSEVPAQASRLLSEDGGLEEAQRALVGWHAVEFPHWEFMRLMPARRVFGWYGCEFDVPQELSGMDVLVDLGIIDDSDETFVNGTKVGGMGRVPDGSAWQSDRLYRIPPHLLTPYRNYMAVHVWSLWGLGGIVGPPVLKAALAPRDGAWEVAFAEGVGGGLNAAETTEKALSLLSGGGRLEWARAPMPWRGHADWRDGCHYAVFRTACTLMDGDSLRRFPSPVVIDCGPVFDVAAFYLNGRRIGLVGRFPEEGAEAFTEAARKARLVVPPDAWAEDGRNELTAVVYRGRGVGGLPGMPGILLHNPLSDDGGESADIDDIYNIYTQSGMAQEAERLLAAAKPKDEGERRRLLSAKAHLSFLRWLDGGRHGAEPLDGVLAPMAEILGKMNGASPTQSAMQAFCRVLRLAERDDAVMEMARRRFPAFGKVCRLLPPDRATQGDWPLFYGGVQTLLPAYGKISDLVHPVGGKGLYSVVTGDPEDPARRWQPKAAAFVADANAHIMPAGQRPREWTDTKWLSEFWRTGRLFPEAKIRRAAWWDDHGEMHPFDDNGPDLTTTLGRAVGKGQLLSLHLGDFDWRRTIHPRQQSILLFDDSGKFLNACWSGKSDLGVYERFVFMEEAKVRFRVMKHRGACVALSGVFIDAAGTADVEDSEEAPPKAAEALALAARAEREHSVPFVVGDYRRLLEETEWEGVLWLVGRLAKSRGMHHVWMSLAAGRLMELKGDRPDDGWRMALKVAAVDCGLASRIPFMGLLTKIAEE